MTDSYIPYGAYWCSPFARWQGSLGHLPSVEFAAHVTRESLASRGIDTEIFDYGVLGMTVPQQFSFYGLPWLAGMVGADHIGGPTISQACATSARVLSVATQEITAGSASCVLAVTTDRLSNGPHLFYPRPGAPGGIGATATHPSSWSVISPCTASPLPASLISPYPFMMICTGGISLGSFPPRQSPHYTTDPPESRAAHGPGR